MLWNEDSGVPSQFTFQLERGTVIGGSVIDEQGEPVEGAFIDLFTPWIESDSPNEVSDAIHDAVRTDAEGKWSTDIVPADLERIDIYMRVRHPDYVYDRAYSDLRKMAAIPAMRSQKAQLVLRRGFAVKGHVVDTAGNPIEGAWVKLAHRRPAGDPKTQTDANGQFRFDEPQLGKTRITVDADGYAPDMQVPDVTASTEAIVFVLEPGNRILGRVIDVNGDPVEGAGILIGDWRTPNSRSMKTFTDPQGCFEWNSAPAGEVKLRVNKKGFMRNETSLVASDEEKEIILHRLLRATGEVLDAETLEPIDEFNLTARTLYRPGSTGIMESQHAGGSFDLTFTSFGPEYEVEVTADNYEPFTSRRFTVDKGMVELKILMVRAAPESIPQGTVHLPDSRVASGAEVYVTTRGLGWLKLEEGRRMNSRAERVLTDSKGCFKLSVQPKRFDLFVIHDAGYAKVSQEQLTKSNEIHLNPWGCVKGVLSSISGPVAYKRVRLSPEPRRLIPGQKDVKFTYTVATDEHGSFVMDRVIAGRMRIRCVTLSKDGTRESEGASKLIDIGPGETTPVELAVGKTVVGKLVIPDEISGFEGWENVYANLESFQFDVEVPARPKEYATMTPKQKADWRNGLYPQSEQEPLWKTQKRVMSRYFYITSDDGSFQIVDVHPGDYTLSLTIWATDKDSDPPGSGMLAIGSMRHLFTVAEMGQGEPNDPLDLGVIVMKPIKQP